MWKFGKNYTPQLLCFRLSTVTNDRGVSTFPVGTMLKYIRDYTLRGKLLWGGSTGALQVFRKNPLPEVFMAYILQSLTDLYLGK